MKYNLITQSICLLSLFVKEVGMYKYQKLIKMKNMNRFLIQAICICTLCRMLAACVQGPDRDIEYNLFVTHPSLKMIEGDEVQITASPTSQSFTWESTDPAVASVSETGYVKALKDGVCIIHVVSSAGLRRAIDVDVAKYVPLAGIVLTNKVNLETVTSPLSLLRKQTVVLEASPSPKDYNERIPFHVVWESSNTDVVTVDNGSVEAVDIGTADITVRSVEKPSVVHTITVVVGYPINE